MILFWIAVIVFFYSAYSLFCSCSASEVARNLIRISIAILLAFNERIENPLILSGLVFFNVFIVLVSMSMMRSEAQE